MFFFNLGLIRLVADDRPCVCCRQQQARNVRSVPLEAVQQPGGALPSSRPARLHNTGIGLRVCGNPRDSAAHRSASTLGSSLIQQPVLLQCSLTLQQCTLFYEVCITTHVRSLNLLNTRTRTLLFTLHTYEFQKVYPDKYTE